MVGMCLERLGVLAAGQSVSANDLAAVGPVLDSLHDQLRKKGLAPFATSAFPMWAQQPFTKALAEEVGPIFGRMQPGGREVGEKELAEQLSGKRHARPTKVQSF